MTLFFFGFGSGCSFKEIENNSWSHTWSLIFSSIKKQGFDPS